MRRRRTNRGLGATTIMIDCPAEARDCYGQYLQECPSVWIAIAARDLQPQYGQRVIRKGTPFMSGFLGRTRQETAGWISDAVANGHWPVRALRPKRVVDCTLRSRRVW